MLKAKDLAETVKECEAIHLELDDEFATALFAEDIALTLKPHDCFALSGDLGVGKTTLIRAIIRTIALSAELEVPSPTFTLVQHYDLRIPIGHFDLYRLTDPNELFELGLDDILKDGVAFIEWPEMAQSELPADLIELTITDVKNHRLIKMSGPCEFRERFARSAKNPNLFK